MPPALRIQLLGEFRLFVNDEPLTSLNKSRQQALLAYLLLHRHAPQPRQQIAFSFWPDTSEGQAYTNLRKIVFQLRRALPIVDDFILADTQSLGWRQDASFSLDVAELEQALDVLKQASTPDVATVERLVVLYRGELLPSCYDDWLLPLRRALHERVVNTLTKALAGLETQHEYEAGLRTAEHLLRLDPLHEAAYRHLMHLRALSGDRAGALRVYRECVAVLKRELDVSPVEATTKLYQEIFEGNSDLQLEKDIRSDLASPLQYMPIKPRHNLPLQLTPFVGRKQELAALDQLLATEEIRLISIVGPGGIGKTRLALEAARQQVDASELSHASIYAHGIHFVALAPLSEPTQIVPTVAEAIGLTLESSGNSTLTPTQQILDYLRAKQTLLVLDNFEHLLDGVALISDILQTAPKVQVLVTSRERLCMPGEQIFWLHGLDIDQSEKSGDVHEPAAVTLFTQNAWRVSPQLALSAEELDHIVCICQLVEGMPLAIELAAAWIDTLSPAEILRELRHSIDFLAVERRGVPERHQSMRAVFDATWQHLDENERRVFAALSVFRGGFTHEAAQTVTGASLRQIRSLTGKSLIEYHPDQYRYTIHELLRQYGALRLAEQPDHEKAARDRHSNYYAALLQHHQAALKGSGQQTALTALDAERENMSTAWRWSVAQGDVRQLAQSMNGMGLYYQLRRLADEGVGLFETAAQSLESAGEPRLLAHVLSWQAACTRLLEQPQLVTQLLARSLHLLDSPPMLHQDVRAERAFALSLMGATAHAQGNYQEHQYYDQSLALFEEVDDAWSAAEVLMGHLDLNRELGNFSIARKQAQRALTLYTKVGNVRGMANARLSLASCEIYLGRPEIALGEIPQSLAVFQGLGDRDGICGSLFDYGHAYLALGEATKARQALHECAAISIELGSQRMEALIYNVLCGVEMMAGDYTLARAYAERSLDTLAEEENHPRTGVYFISLGWATLFIGNSRIGLEILRKSVAILDKIGGVADRCWAYALLALGEWMNGLSQPAGNHSLLALRLGKQCAEQLPVSIALSTAMVILAEAEDPYALELYGLLQNYPYCNSAAWWRGSVGQYMQAVVAEHPDEVVRVALHTGEEAELWEVVGNLTDHLLELGWNPEVLSLNTDIILASHQNHSQNYGS